MSCRAQRVRPCHDGPRFRCVSPLSLVPSPVWAAHGPLHTTSLALHVSLTVDVTAAAAAVAAVHLTCAGTDAFVEGADPMMTATPKGNVNMTYGSSCPVNEFPPSATGFYDVHGNVWEWVSGAALLLRILRLLWITFSGLRTPLHALYPSPAYIAGNSCVRNYLLLFFCARIAAAGEFQLPASTSPVLSVYPCCVCVCVRVCVRVCARVCVYVSAFCMQVEDHFAPLPEFEIHFLYDDFSTPCFDGWHTGIMGGSWISCGQLASNFARYHFRRHFFQHLGFRCVGVLWVDLLWWARSAGTFFFPGRLSLLDYVFVGWVVCSSYGG